MQRLDGGASLPQSTKDKLFLSSLENVEYSILLETEARTMRWGWLCRTYVQWHAIAFLLSELCVRTKGELVDRAWRAVEATVASRFGNPLTESKRGILWKPLRKLMVKARAARQAELAREETAFAARQLQSGMGLPAQRRQPGFAEAYPYFEARLQSASSPSFGSSLPAQSAATMTTRTTQASLSPSNKAAQDFNEISDHGFDWLMGDVLGPELTTMGSQLVAADEPVDWANWDDMVQQYGMEVDETSGSAMHGGAGPGGMVTWF